MKRAFCEWQNALLLNMGDHLRYGLEQIIENVANRKKLVNIQNRMNVIGSELKRVTYADVLDMEQLAGLKAIVELFQAVNE